MGIVLPDGILGNPNTEPVRKWILEHFKLLASVDLPVETFLPQVGVQASLLFLHSFHELYNPQATTTPNRALHTIGTIGFTLGRIMRLRILQKTLLRIVQRI